MAIGKWIGGVLGWIASGGSILGALAGYAIGSLIDGAVSAGSSASNTDYEMGDDGGYDEGERNSFLFSMMVLSSYIIKADGKIMHSEMEFVRMFLRQNFGEIAVAQGEEILMRLFEEQKRQGSGAFRETIRKSCVEIRYHMNEELRLQLLSYLVMIAKADGRVTDDERAALLEVTLTMGLSHGDLESLLAMGYQWQGTRDRGQGTGNNGSSYSRPDSGTELANAYKVLGISPSATDDEVKKAYRQLALKHHPDKVASLGDDVRKAAERKFQEINNAKEIVFKARGL